MYKNFNSKVRDNIGFYTEPVFGDKDSCPICQNPSQDFNIDASTGRPMEDITSLIRASDDLEARRIVNAMPEFKSDNLPDDMSDSDAIRYMKPSLCQLPSELKRFHESIGQFMIDKKQELADKLKAEKEQRLNEAVMNQLGVSDVSSTVN